jgi:hypothetical protein
MGEMRNAYNVFVRKPEQKRRENNVRMDLKKNWAGRYGLNSSGSG